MSILITHGYLLTGTGSNLYVNNLVRELVKKGHDVVLVCQDFDPIKIDFINEVHEFDASNTSYSLTGKQETPFPGKCTCFKPNLNGFLPVYVYDHYEGFEVKEFNSCSNEEVMRYVQQNQSAMDVILKDIPISVINTNHMVMFPYVAAQLKKTHDFKFVITVHGSALNFTVKKDTRFENYAIESLKVVDEIVVDSLHADEELKEFLEEVNMTELIEKMEIIPAGVDISSFGILTQPRDEAKANFIQSIRTNVDSSEGRSTQTTTEILYTEINSINLSTIVENTRKAYDYRHIDKDCIEKFEAIDINKNNVFFVGKYLWTKGIYLLLTALPKILKSHPQTNFILAGFGPFREPAEIIINQLASGNIDQLPMLLNEELFEGEDKNVIPLIHDILQKHGDQIKADISALDTDIRDHITFTGILNHAQLIHLLPAMDVLIAPSVFPEAFGMVAIEAASCGVYPVVTYQSAFKEIGDQITELVDGRIAINNVLLDADAADNIAINTTAYLNRKQEMTTEELSNFKDALRKLVVDNYSWEGIAGKYLNTFS